jgi:hypothetical protein
MFIGDMVVRAYAWHSIVPGIIIDEEYTAHGPVDNREYESHNFIVLWSDGSNSREMYEELDRLEDIEELIRESR